MRRFRKTLMLLFTIVGTTLFLACSGEKDEPKVSIPTMKSIQVGTSFSLGVTGHWFSSNDFIASVDNFGYVHANHVGECTIGNGTMGCKVTVTPKSTFFITQPITEWGTSKSTIIYRCGWDYKESGDYIAYISNNTIAPITMYGFDDNNSLTSSTVVVDTNYTTELVEFLTERYQPIGQDGYNFFFTNGYTIQTISTAVGLRLYNKSYWMVMYIPYNNSSRSSADRELTNNLSDIINKFKLL